MEKFRIAQYGFIQMVALAYGILASGMIVKAAKFFSDHGYSLSPGLQAIVLFHNYGIFLSLLIVVWAAICAYHSSIFSGWNVGERAIVTSGLILSGAFFVLGLILTFMGLGIFFSSPL